MGTETTRIEAYTMALIQGGAVKVAPDTDHLFELRNGTKSCAYVDHGEILCQPDTFQPYIDALADSVCNNFPEHSTILVNVDSKSSPHTVGALASLLRLRQIVVNPEATRLAEKGPSLGVRLPKEIKASDTLVVIDDVFTEGDTTAIDAVSLAIDAIASRFGVTEQETHLVVGLLRGDMGKATKQLERSKIKLHWLTT
ncbi:MAG TPA: hypothetical protein VLF67_05460, partial [Candidatus Saccharimonas sp.]|nr:hypothetical protein [Candidatus Saccharimonas sp.]